MSMKKLFHTVILFLSLILLSPAANAISFNVVVLPADLMNVCDNYYCYPEVSEIIANDLIQYFNRTGRINSPSLIEVRRRLAANPQLRTALQQSLIKYRNSSNIDFHVYKKVADLFSAKSVLVVANTVNVENAYVKRNVWEILELATALDFTYPFFMETEAVLLDTYNGLVMWSGNYSKKISDNNGNFSAPKSSQSYSKLGFIEFYSEDIISKTIGENVVLRFFPKTISPMVNPKNVKPTGEFLRYESKTPAINRPEREELNPDAGGYGELIFGI